MECYVKCAYAFEAVLEILNPKQGAQVERLLPYMGAVSRNLCSTTSSVVACMKNSVEGGSAGPQTLVTHTKALRIDITSSDFSVAGYHQQINNALCSLKGLSTSFQAEAKDIIEASSEAKCESTATICLKY